jgi:dolichol kinase
MKEIDRQLVHLNIGLFFILLMAVFGMEFCMAFIFACVVAALLIVHLKMEKKRVPVVDWFLGMFEREGVVPGYGSFLYMAGTLILFAFLRDPARIAASILILGIGDGMATIVGMEGETRIPYNKKKTVEGSIAFFAFCLPVFFLSGIGGVFAALVSAIVESLPLGVDDNITIPIACVAVFRLIG